MRNVMTGMLAAAGMIAGAGAAAGQTVEFRIVERQGQMSIPSQVGTTATTDATLNFSVQARVVGGAANAGLGNFAFNVHIVGEPEANGTLARLLTSNVDGTYAVNSNQTVSSTVGRGGLAAPYAYLAGITQGFFNGLINVSGGSFTNTPDQEILAITGSPTGGSMLLVTDADADGNPDTYVGPLMPAPGATATVTTTQANTYFAANGNWVDVYRFRYVVSNTTTGRFLHIVLDGQGSGPNAQVFSGWAFLNGVWGPAAPTNANVVLTGVNIEVSGASLTGACCQGAACSVLLEIQCAAAAGQYRGDSVACLPAGSFNACCVGNFDGENGLQVADIFAFLSAWFAGDRRADIDQNGTLNIYDIFAFLGTWRNGC